MKNIGENIGDWIRKWASIYPDKIAVINNDLEITYRELNRNVNRIANLFLKKDIKKGDRVGVLIYNSPAYIEIYFALAKVGAILVPLNWRLSGREIQYILTDSGAVALFFESDFSKTIETIRSEIPVREKNFVCVFGEVPSWAVSIEELIKKESISEPNVKEPAGEEDAHIFMYTSGTTGVPKGSILSHRKTFYNSLNASIYYDLSCRDIFLMPRPLFHSGGLLVALSPVMYRGATIILSKRFSPVEILENIQKHKVSILEAPTTLYRFILEQCEIERYDLSSLRCCYTGGERVSMSVLDEFARKGITVSQIYGQTETSTLTWLPAGVAKRKRGSVGIPVFHGDIRVVKKDGSDVAVDEVGEIVVSGQITMSGYWGHPDLTKKDAFANGWLHTGDLAKVDEEGFLYLMDRKKDMYISGGENVYPAEIEKVLLENPMILDAGCIGVPDEKWGETGMVFVIPKEPENFQVEELQEYCSEKLAKFKIPKYISVIDELPRNAAGKILKNKLRDMFLAYSK